MTYIALGFGVYLDVVIEKNRRRSRAALRILRLNSIQRCPEDKMQDWPCYFFTGPKAGRGRVLKELGKKGTDKHDLNSHVRL